MSPPSAPQPARATAARRASRRAGARALQAGATREHLIGTTIALIGTRSYQAATVAEVAKAAGMTHGAVQHHFGSKAMLMMEVIDAIVRASGPEGIAWPDAGLPLAARCQGLVQALWQRAYAAPRFLAAWAVYFGSADAPEVRGHVAQRRQAVAQALHQRFLAVLPELAAHPDGTAVVQLVLSALRGLGVVRLFACPGPAEDAQLRLLAGLLQSQCEAGALATAATGDASAASRRAPRRAPSRPPADAPPDPNCAA